MDIQAMGEVLLYGALFLGMCLLIATKAVVPIEVEEEIEEVSALRYERNVGNPRRKRKKIIRYYL